MEHEIEVKGRAYTFHSGELDDNIDMEKEISIDYSNLAGDAVITPLVSNSVGIMVADLEHEVSLKKLEIDIYEADFKKEKRRLGAKSGDKVTEKSLETLHCTEEDWQLLKNELFMLEAYLKKVSNFYWKLEGKSEKLKMYLKEIMPEEFEQEVIEKALSKSSRGGQLGQ
jgi:hypothetical protein